MKRQINNINFQAIPIKKINPKTINKINNNGTYQKYEPCLVEFDKNNFYDLYALENLVSLWDKQLYAGTIRENAKKIRKKELSPIENRIFILTTQKESYDKLNENKILGIAHMYKGKSSIANLKYIQVKPQTKFGVKERKYTDIGKALLDYIKDLYKCNIKAKVYYPAIGFYEKRGFENIDTTTLEYMWKA